MGLQSCRRRIQAMILPQFNTGNTWLATFEPAGQFGCSSGEVRFKTVLGALGPALRARSRICETVPVELPVAAAISAIVSPSWRCRSMSSTICMSVLLIENSSLSDDLTKRETIARLSRNRH